MAVSYPSTAFRRRTITLGLSRRDRRAIEQEIEALIALLDEIDGDADLEEDELHDDPLDLGEEPYQAAMLPIYRVDQTLGPTNYRQAIAQHERRYA